MANIPSEYEGFWARGEQLHAELRRRDRFLEAFAFGDSERMADELAALVLQGVKRATAGLLWSHEHEKKPLPQPGDLSIVTNGAKEPLCVIETLAVDIVPFNAVSEDFARTEGEDDGTLESWTRIHTTFFNSECARIGRVPDSTMPVVCERFRVIYQP